MRAQRPIHWYAQMQASNVLEMSKSAIICTMQTIIQHFKRITYLEFDSRKGTSFTCTPDHRLTLTTIGTRPFASKNRVYWFTLCDREFTVKDDDPRPSSSLSDAPLMKLDNADEDRFAAVRKSLDSNVCECGGLRKVQRYFKSEKQDSWHSEFCKAISSSH
ncbi:hypothetical protein V1506DRAFT_571193 [Lipomyces tetrasporus]